MKTSHQLMQEIISLTHRINSEYPELYIYLGETPIKSTDSGEKLFDLEELQKYLDTLRSQLEGFKHTRNKES
ncbi:MAG: hypothetical protein WBN50_09105 [Lutimonas sp.]